MKDTVRWGILGGGSYVANAAVIPAIQREQSSTLAAFSSLSHPETLPLELLGAQRMPSYQDLIDPSLIDALYIATPNSLHAKWIVAALQRGISVLCEKPIVVSPTDLDEIELILGQTSGLVMEAYMTQFNNRDHVVRGLATDGEIGGILKFETNFSFTNSDSSNYRWDKALGGGALLDVGIYILDPIIAILGWPKNISVLDKSVRSGVDVSLTILLSFAGGQEATCTCSFIAPETQFLRISGTQSTITLENPFTPSLGDDTIVITSKEGTSRTVKVAGDDPYYEMVHSFVECHRNKTPAPRSLERSRVVLSLIDEILIVAGLRQPHSQ